PLGDLDEASRVRTTERLRLHRCAEGEIVVEKGSPVSGILVVGAGSIDRIGESSSTHALTSGDLVFGRLARGGGSATRTARAGQGGALLLAADREATRALFAELPQLGELFSKS